MDTKAQKLLYQEQSIITIQNLQCTCIMPDSGLSVITHSTSPPCAWFSKMELTMIKWKDSFLKTQLY